MRLCFVAIASSDRGADFMRAWLAELPLLVLVMFVSERIGCKTKERRTTPGYLGQLFGLDPNGGAFDASAD